MPTILSLSTEERSIRQALASISDQLGLTDEERAVKITSGGKTLIKSRIEWAITYLVHAGLMTRPRRGHFLITARGRDVLAKPPPKIDQAFLRQFPEFRDFLSRRRLPSSAIFEVAVARTIGSETAVVPKPDEQIGEAY